jgi:DNA-binding NarL/FixJ family response regulator
MSPCLIWAELKQRIRVALHKVVVILSMHSDEGYVLRALKAGAEGYLLKDPPEGDLIEAIKSVHQGKTFFCPEIPARCLWMIVSEESGPREWRTTTIS